MLWYLSGINVNNSTSLYCLLFFLILLESGARKSLLADALKVEILARTARVLVDDIRRTAVDLDRNGEIGFFFVALHDPKLDFNDWRKVSFNIMTNHATKITGNFFDFDFQINSNREFI